MYGFAEDIDLSHLKGGEVTRILIDRYNLCFEFDNPPNSISISGEWTVRDNNKEVIDKGLLGEEKDSYKAHALLGRKIKSYEIDAPKSMRILFEDNWELEVIDSSVQYETCSITPDIVI